MIFCLKGNVLNFPQLTFIGMYDTYLVSMIMKNKQTTFYYSRHCTTENIAHRMGQWAIPCLARLAVIHLIQLQEHVVFTDRL